MTREELAGELEILAASIRAGETGEPDGVGIVVVTEDRTAVETVYWGDAAIALIGGLAVLSRRIHDELSDVEPTMDAPTDGVTVGVVGEA